MNEHTVDYIKWTCCWNILLYTTFSVYIFCSKELFLFFVLRGWYLLQLIYFIFLLFALVTWLTEFLFHNYWSIIIIMNFIINFLSINDLTLAIKISCSCIFASRLFAFIFKYISWIVSFCLACLYVYFKNINV